MRETGVLSPKKALDLCVVGVVARASGINHDCRVFHPFPPYDRPEEIELDVPVLVSGDVHARAWVRVLEVRESVRLIRYILENLPEGPFWRRSPPPPPGVAGFAAVEGWRGEIVYWLQSGPRRRGQPLHGARPLVAQLDRPGAGGAREHRPGFPALQQELQPVLFRDTTCDHGYSGTSSGPGSSPSRCPTRSRARSSGSASGWRPASGSAFAAASRSARSMPARATAASWRSTRSTTRSTTASASACTSPPRRASPTCCS